MIVQEIEIIRNREFKHTYSDNKLYIQQVETGDIYADAFDVMTADYHYVETDIPLPEPPEPESV